MSFIIFLCGLNQVGTIFQFKRRIDDILVGGFNPSEKYESQLG